MSLALSNCILFISVMQSINGAQFLNVTFLFLLPGAAVVTVFGIAIVLLTCITITT